MDYYKVLDEVKRVKAFFNTGDFIVFSNSSSAPSRYFWGIKDFKKKFKRKELNKFYIYSLIENKNEAYIVDGYKKKQALGYFISKEKILLPDNKIRYW